MNILNKLTLKNLKMNKKRTLVTIIGIALSTALMVGIGLLVSSFLESERENAIKLNGPQHATYLDLDVNDLATLSKNVNIKKISSYTPIGNAKFNSMFDNKKYLYISEASNNFLNSLEIIEGRLPKNANELVISNDLLTLTEDKYKVGDIITLDIGARVVDGEELDISHNYSIATSWTGNEFKHNEEKLNIKMTKTYTIVGIIKEVPYENFNDAGSMVFSKEENSNNPSVALVEFKNPQKTFDYVKDISDTLGLNDVQVNEGLLYYYGATKYSNVNDTILPLILIALSVISIGCIIVIYNSFAISTMERKKSFGLYASIGTTETQIRKTVLFEAFIVGIIGIILGLLGGFLGIYTVLQIINYLIKDTIDLNLKFVIEPLYIIIPLIFMILVILISAYLPAKRSSKTTPITAIKGNEDIKISKKEVKSPKFISKIFGIEGVIAYKNIKRNKKKYRITIISLFISIVMFNTFTSFLGYIIKTTNSFDYYDHDVAINFHGSKDQIIDDLNTIKNNYSLSKSLSVVDTNNAYLKNLTPNDYTKDYRDVYLDQIIDESTSFKYHTMIVALSNEDYAKISSKEAVLLNDKYFNIYENDTRITKRVKIFKDKNYNLELNFNDKLISIEAEVLNDSEIFGLRHEEYYPVPLLVMSLDTYQKYFNYDETYSGNIYFNSKDYKEIVEKMKNKEIPFRSSYEYYSPRIEEAGTKNLALAIKILVYGFISLVTLIGITSVINTINTNIALRRKEFAMLRSIGLTPRGFNKMLFLESMFFGAKSLIYGLPVSMAINMLIAKVLNGIITTKTIIPWNYFIISIISVFIIVLLSMNYASKKIKKENILEALREENI